VVGFEFGRVYNYLLKHRIIRTKTSARQKLREEEKEIATYLHEEMNEKDRSFLFDFLDAQGFSLEVYDSSMMDGIPEGAYWYILVRDVNGQVPSWIDVEALREMIKPSKKTNELAFQSYMWIYIIWQNLLTLLYTNKNREIIKVSEYLNTQFTEEDLVTLTLACIEDLRRDTASLADHLKYILDEKPTFIRRRVGNFIAFMERYNHLSSIRKENEFKKVEAVYTQTLLSAVEIARNYDRGSYYYLPEDMKSTNHLNTVFIEDNSESM